MPGNVGFTANICYILGILKRMPIRDTSAMREKKAD